MKEIPMLFSTPMVIALLEGRKTQTRRIMKPQIKDCDHSRFTEAERKDQPTQWSDAALKAGRAYCGMCGNGVEYSKDYGGIKCPYGVPGDLLYARETWSPYLRGTDDNGYIELIKYKADGAEIAFKHLKDYSELGWRNRPGIHMNKEYARIWLKKTATKVERACDISEADAIAEGVEKIGDGAFPWKHYGSNTASCADAKTSFQSLWWEINGPETWNDWVWVNEFEIISTAGRP